MATNKNIHKSTLHIRQSPKKKRKTILSSHTSRGAGRKVILHGVECADNIYLCYFALRDVRLGNEVSFYTRPLQEAVNQWSMNRSEPLYSQSDNNLDFGSIFKVDNCYSRVNPTNHSEHLPNRPDSPFGWPLYLFSRPEVGDESPESNWTLMQWLQNFRTEFCNFIHYTSAHPTQYGEWNIINNNIAIEMHTHEEDHPLSDELVDNDVIHTIRNSYDYMINRQDLLNNDEVMILYFGSNDANVRRRIHEVVF